LGTKESMNHIAGHRWADYGRGLMTEIERAAADAHLASGCTSCRRTAEVMARMTQMGRAEAEYEVPSHLRQQALDLFVPPRRKRKEKLSRVFAQLVYDSMREPLPAGVRASGRPNQILYDAGDFALDLQVSSERAGTERQAPRLVLVGQIADRRKPARPLADVPVLLLSGRQVAARTLSNELGEFHLECEPAKRLSLQVWVSGDRRIEVPVRRVREVGK
jgi:hypothetical protein